MTPSERLDQLIDETITNMQKAQTAIDTIDHQVIAKFTASGYITSVITNLENLKKVIEMGLAEDIDNAMEDIDSMYDEGW